MWCVRVCASERAEQDEKGVVYMGREGEGECAGTELRFTWGGRTPRCLRQGVNETRHGANRAGTRALPPTDGAGLAAVTVAWNLGSAGAALKSTATGRQAPTDRRMEKGRWRDEWLMAWKALLTRRRERLIPKPGAAQLWPAVVGLES